jgi:hypothetical protein
MAGFGRGMDILVTPNTDSFSNQQLVATKELA